MSDIKFTEVELNRIELNPGEVLIATVKSDELDGDSMSSLAEMLRGVFPNNKVIVMGTGSEGNINFTVAKDALVSDTKVGCGTTPTNFCTDCSCGKKEAYEQGETK